MPAVPRTDHVDAVVKIVKTEFGDHPGDADDFRWPTTRSEAEAWLEDFIEKRLAQFGPYEDAMTTRSATVFHSLLSPCLNLGLLTPDEVVQKAVEHGGDAPLQSLEGFVRQVIGWREFVRGVYREYGERQEDSNFWAHERGLTSAWYEGTTGIVPLDDTIKTAQRFGWVHHIPRLMVLGNLMTLCEIQPATAHHWFMEMFVDSSEWVMGPNVYGMGLYSDGGCEVVDGLYWRFIDKHRKFFAGNPRLAVMPRTLDRLKDERREKIFAAAEAFLEEHTTPMASG